MIPRERMLAAVRRQPVDRVPREFRASPRVMEVFREKTGSDDLVRYYDLESCYVDRSSWAFSPSFDECFPEPLVRKLQYDPWDEALHGRRTIDEWGTQHLVGSLYHFERMSHVLQDFSGDVREFESYPFPKVADDRHFADVAEEVATLRRDGRAAMGYGGCIFEQAWYMRSMEKLLVDLRVNPAFVEHLLDRITELNMSIAARLTGCGIDILDVGDDVAMQEGMLMSPRTWREWFKPRLARVIQAARRVNPALLVFYHCDGNMAAIIPDLIEVGVNALHPMQPECMDLALLKRQFGRDATFWGTIGTQTTFPFATPAEMRDTVRWTIETLGQGSGLVIGPTHYVEPDVPWENVEAFFEAVCQYGDQI